MGEESTMWNFQGDEHLNQASACIIRSFLTTLQEILNQNDGRAVIPLGHGDWRSKWISEFSDFSNEAYGYLAFGSTPFVPMESFESIVPVLTIGSLSKRWMVLGWHLGWILTSDPNGILQNTRVVLIFGRFCTKMMRFYKYEWCSHLFPMSTIPIDITECIESYLDISSDASNITQGALPQILKKTPESFHSKTLNMLREAAYVCHARLKEIPCISCPCRPQVSMFLMVKLNLLLLKDINDDDEFCIKLSREESAIVLPGRGGARSLYSTGPCFKMDWARV
ncbi:putative aminotransferase TAT2 [Abeliophyllum distichum]|uniref:Aminotransferase TAT2 n=1 Tax=Abeliophyllum distichum TaxID=126358 RepID=A0ABD1PRG7_9LAMI